tara:strand:- start:11237 stop:12283 length:1047 start_codon:yes stop_codon:yes gene_type:complete
MRIIKIDGEIGWDINARDFKTELNLGNGDVTIEISSPGGSVYQGVEIFNAIKSYDKGKVTTVITSIAASMGSYIALAGDNVKAYDNAVYMIHNASVFSMGDARALRKSAMIVESLSNLLAKEYILKTGKSVEEIAKMMDDETYLFGSEILDNGFVDEIISSEKEIDSSSATALASESVKACMSSYKDHFEKEDTAQVAAILKQFETDGEKVTIPTAQSDKIAKSKKENSMTEYTKQNFEALEQANAKALEDGISGATALERKRVSGIMALQGSSDVKMKAIEDGSEIGTTAIALNAAFATVVAKEKTDFEKAANELNGNVNATAVTDALSAEAAALEADDAKYYKEGK